MRQPTRFDYKIDSGHVDFQKDISPVVLADMIVNSAGKDADQQRLGLVDLQAKNCSWVVSRFVMELECIPTLGDDLSVETWVKDVNNVFTTRNFRLTNKPIDDVGRVMGYAALSWAVIDLDTRRGMPMSKIPELNRYIIDEEIPIEPLRRIPDIEGQVASAFEVKYSDIDLNVHTNILKYLEAICDVFSLNFYSKRVLKRMEVNFLRELSFGDKGTLYYEEVADNDFLFKLVTNEGVTASRSRMVFESKL